MSPFISGRIALAALAQNRMRSLLTTLGIVIGVSAVITMVALGTGAQEMVRNQVRSAGTNVVTVNAGNFMAGGVRLGQGAATTLTLDDAAAIAELAQVLYISPGVNTRAQIVAAAQNWSTRIEGTGVDMPLIREWPLRNGSYFTKADVDAAAKVAVLGSVVSDTLFGAGVDPTGQSIRIRNQPFKVVGRMASKGQSAMGQDQDDIVFIPFTTAQKKLLGITHLQNLTVSATSSAAVIPVADEIVALLRARHRIQPGQADDFMVRTVEEMATVMAGTSQTMTILLSSIAGVSLVVGGIGIMNIMLVSVTERTREIGLRRAVGARRSDVLLQFLIEALTISLLGGVLGLAVGVAASDVVRRLLQWPTAVSLEAVALAIGFSALVGVVFGYYPAHKAAHLAPVDALRYE